jgi:hypothetical protein
MGMDWSLREGNTSVTHIPTAIHSCKLIVITLCPSLLTSVFVIFTYLNVFPKTTGPIVTKLDSNVIWLILGVVFHFHSILKFNMVARTSYALWLVKTSKYLLFRNHMMELLLCITFYYMNTYRACVDF